MSREEIEAAIHSDSRHADRLRSVYSSKERVFKYQLGFLTAKDSRKDWMTNNHLAVSYYVRKRCETSHGELITTFLSEDEWSLKMKLPNPCHPLLHKKILKYGFH